MHYHELAIKEEAKLASKNTSQESDPYAELKDAHAKGARIEWNDGSWTLYLTPMHKDPLWIHPAKDLRIHPDDLHLVSQEAKADTEQPWIEHNGGPCPLKDDEVEEWEWTCRNGSIYNRSHCADDCGKPSNRFWSHSGSIGDIIAYRVTKAKPATVQPGKSEEVLEQCQKCHVPMCPSQIEAGTCFKCIAEEALKRNTFFQEQFNKAEAALKKAEGERDDLAKENALMEEVITKWSQRSTLRTIPDDETLQRWVDSAFDSVNWQNDVHSRLLLAKHLLSHTQAEVKEEKQPEYYVPKDRIHGRYADTAPTEGKASKDTITKMVPLEVKDVPPGSVVRGTETPDKDWAQIVCTNKEGISLTTCQLWNSFEEIMIWGWQINRSIPMTGKWDATAWEPCSKPAP
jgi:hypothetical protein